MLESLSLRADGNHLLEHFHNLWTFERSNLTLLQVIRNKGFFSMKDAAPSSSKNAFEIIELLANNENNILSLYSLLAPT